MASETSGPLKRGSLETLNDEGQFRYVKLLALLRVYEARDVDVRCSGHSIFLSRLRRLKRLTLKSWRRSVDQGVSGGGNNGIDASSYSLAL